jgi:hypothetical protein
MWRMLFIPNESPSKSMPEVLEKCKKRVPTFPRIFKRESAPKMNVMALYQMHLDNLTDKKKP